MAARPTRTGEHPNTKTLNHAFAKFEDIGKSDSPSEETLFYSAYKASFVNGVFKMSDDVMRRLILWHRRLCHPSADRLRWTIKNTVGIDMQASDVDTLPCEACDMGKSVKFKTTARRSRMTYVGEGWHCDVGTLNPTSIEGQKYFFDH